MSENLNLTKLRHSQAHLLAAAVVEMFPEVKLGIGPSIENGFYYDFDLPRTLIPEDLPILEKKMKHLQKQNLTFEAYEEPINKARDFLKEIKQDYKIELLDELEKEGEKSVTFYKNGDFVDMCKGPHVDSTIKTGVFKLTSIAGAYWRGNEKNKMLQRIYGVGFEKKEELDQYLKDLEEAKKRDHRKIGKALDLFSFHEEGPGFPFWHSKGTILFNELTNYMREQNYARGYDEIRTPPLLSDELWHRSGHWDNFKENMYFTEIDERGFAVKPMNCPGGLLVYKEKVPSYRELPLKNAEFGLVHRHELSGVLYGLFRVRSFTQDDAHIFCTEEQMGEQIKETIQYTLDVYKQFGFKDFEIFIATRPEKSLGSDEIWEMATEALQNSLNDLKIPFKLKIGEGAFYGPKIEFNIKDCLKRNWQCGTIQVDFSMPTRFELEYTGADGEKHRPVMIHRAILGSLERFIGILIENFAGAMPTWLAPVQAVVIPVAEAHQNYAQEVLALLKKAGIRTEISPATESLGKRIRSAEMDKIPYMLVIGDKEVESKSLTVRDYKTKEQKPLETKVFMENVLTEIKERKL